MAVKNAESMAIGCDDFHEIIGRLNNAVRALVEARVRGHVGGGRSWFPREESVARWWCNLLIPAASLVFCSSLMQCRKVGR